MARRRPAARRGSVLLYSVLLMGLLLGVASLAVDYGHVQTVKTELQRCADATARGVLEQYGQSTTPDPTTISGWNTVDAGFGIAPTVTVTWGWWNATSNTFTTGSGSPVAVRVTVSRTAAAANAVPLTFSVVTGASFSRLSCDVAATSIAYLTPASTTTTPVPSRSDLWLAGMPAGSTAGDTDNTTNAPATLALNVTPGSVLTFASTGTTSDNASNPYFDAGGNTSNVMHHMQYATSTHVGLQNGIQDVTVPDVSLLGVFLTNAAPNTVTPPATALDYSTTASQNQNTLTNLQVQQPFLVGDGKTTASVTQTFVVPPNATRLYLGTFDTQSNNDNRGSLSVTITKIAHVTTVK